MKEPDWEICSTGSKVVVRHACDNKLDQFLTSMMAYDRIVQIDPRTDIPCIYCGKQPSDKFIQLAKLMLL